MDSRESSRDHQHPRHRATRRRRTRCAACPLVAHRGARHRLHPRRRAPRTSVRPVLGLDGVERELPLLHLRRPADPDRTERVGGDHRHRARQPLVDRGRLAVGQRSGLGNAERLGDARDVRDPGQPDLRCRPGTGHRTVLRDHQHHGRDVRHTRTARTRRGSPSCERTMGGPPGDRGAEPRAQRVRIRRHREGVPLLLRGTRARVRRARVLRLQPGGLRLHRGTARTEGSLGRAAPRLRHRGFGAAVVGNRRRLLEVPAEEDLDGRGRMVDRARRSAPDHVHQPDRNLRRDSDRHDGSATHHPRDRAVVVRPNLPRDRDRRLHHQQRPGGVLGGSLGSGTRVQGASVHDGADHRLDRHRRRILAHVPVLRIPRHDGVRPRTHGHDPRPTDGDLLGRHLPATEPLRRDCSER